MVFLFLAVDIRLGGNVSVQGSCTVDGCPVAGFESGPGVQAGGGFESSCAASQGPCWQGGSVSREARLPLPLRWLETWWLVVGG